MRRVAHYGPLALLALVAVLAACSWIVALAPAHGPLTVTFLDVGQGDSTVIQTPDGHVMVVDAGRTSDDDDSGRRVVLPYLRSHGINHLNALLLTHPDDDHIGGAASILDRIAVDRLLVPPRASPSIRYRHVLDVARSRRVPILEAVRGQALDFHDSVTAEVDNPPSDPTAHGEESDNAVSIVLRVRRGETALLLAADADVAAETDMARSGLPLAAQVLKLGHHGSKSATSDRLLDCVRPRIAIVSAGKRNAFGHPHPSVLARLAARRILVYRTDRNGSIRLTSDGHSWSVSTALAPPGR